MADTRKVQAAVNMLPEAVSFDEGNLTSACQWATPCVALSLRLHRSPCLFKNINKIAFYRLLNNNS